MPPINDPLVTMLTTLRTALMDRNTWSLEPLVAICAQAIELRQQELGARPPSPPPPPPPVKSVIRRRHDSDEPILLEPGELWP